MVGRIAVAGVSRDRMTSFSVGVNPVEAMLSVVFVELRIFKSRKLT